MKIRTVQLIYFSPTRTTRKVLEGIAAGMDAVAVDHLDLTKPAADAGVDVQADLVIIGAPVYSGRIPKTAVDRISKITARNVPAVIVAVYGNRAYEDALVELKDLAESAGLVPIAAGAFIGEHSFSKTTTPVAQDRPDTEDLQEANAFGRRIRSRLDEIEGLAGMGPLEVPGNRPYKDRHSLPTGSPGTLVESCTLCGTCADVCPVDAIRVEDTVVTDVKQCIFCCACIKFCPEEVRVMTVQKINEIAEKLSNLCAERKAPEYFMC
jgi:ferredoxin